MVFKKIPLWGLGAGIFVGAGALAAFLAAGGGGSGGTASLAVQVLGLAESSNSGSGAVTGGTEGASARLAAPPVIPLASSFPYAFHYGVDTSAMLVFRDFREVTLTATQAELRQHFYDFEPFIGQTLTVLAETIRDPEQSQPIKSWMQDISMPLYLGEDLLAHINTYAARLPQPTTYDHCDIDEFCEEPGYEPPICTEEYLGTNIVYSGPSCFQSLDRLLGAAALYTLDPPIRPADRWRDYFRTAERRQVRWKIFDPSTLAPADAGGFLRNQVTHWVPVIDEAFLDENFRTSTRGRMALAIWKSVADPALSSSWDGLLLSRPGDATEQGLLSESPESRFRKLLPRYLQAHLGNWQNGNGPDCYATGFSATIPGWSLSPFPVYPWLAAPDLAEALVTVEGRGTEADYQQEIETQWQGLSEYLGTPAGTPMPDLFRAARPVRTGSLLAVVLHSATNGVNFALPVHVAVVIGAVVERDLFGQDQVIDLLIAEKNLNGIYPVHTELLSQMMRRVEDSTPQEILAYEFQGRMPEGVFALPDLDGAILRGRLAQGHWSTCMAEQGGSRRIDFALKPTRTFTNLETAFASADCSGPARSSGTYTSGVYRYVSESVLADGSTRFGLDLLGTYPAVATGSGFVSYRATATVSAAGGAGESLAVTVAAGQRVPAGTIRYERAEAPPLLSCLETDESCVQLRSAPPAPADDGG